MKERNPEPILRKEPEDTEGMQDIVLLNRIEDDSTVQAWLRDNPTRSAVFALVSGIVTILPACSSKEPPNEKDLRCLADNVFYESSAATKTIVENGIKKTVPSESEMGDRAVALVTIARAVGREFPKTVCAVVYQPKQFSWTSWTLLRKKAVRIQRRNMYPRAERIAKETLLSTTSGNAHDAQKVAHELETLGLSAETYWYKRSDDIGVSEQSKRWFKNRLTLSGTVSGSSHAFFKKRPVPKPARLHKKQQR